MFTFSLTEEESNIVLQGLGELPAKTSLSVINKIQQQAQEQFANSQKAETLESND